MEDSTDQTERIKEILDSVTRSIEVIQDVQADIISIREQLARHNTDPYAHPNLKVGSN